MTTRLTKAVKREVSTRRSGDLIITLTTSGIVLREKGRRKVYGPVDYGLVFLTAVKQAIKEREQEKAALKAARKTTTKRRRK
jgi:hypothetical protein